MSFCSNCGNRVNDTDKFCRSCGTSLSRENLSQESLYVYGSSWQSQSTPSDNISTRNNKKQRTVGRTIGYIILALGIIITVVGGLFFGLAFFIGNGLEQSKTISKILNDDKELAKYCAKSTVCQTYNVDDDDVNWKEVKCIKSNEKKNNLVYIDCKFKDSEGRYKHLRLFIVINKIKYDEEDHDVEWKSASYDWDEDEYSFDELKEKILKEYDFDD